MLQRMILCTLLVFLGTHPASAQTAAAPASAGEARSQQLQQDPVDVKIQQALRERDAVIRNLLERVQELENRLNAPGANTGANTAPPRVATAVAAAPAALVPAADPVIKAESVVTNSAYDDEERRASQALDQALLVRGGLLLPSGMMEIDNTASYFSMSSDHLTVDGFALLPVLVVGDITSQQLRRDILIHSATTRLGLPGKMQMTFMVPYGVVIDRTVDATSKETAATQFGLGDIQAGLSRQFLFERGSKPDLLADFQYKSNTGTNSYDLQSAETSLGTGFNSLTADITLAKTSDPVVFFSNVSYTRSLPARHTVPVSNPSDPSMTSTVGYLRPGDAFGFQLGSILAMNTETSFTVGWDQRFTQETKLNGVRLPASYLVEGSLRIGTSYMYAPGRMVDLSFGVGLTPDTPSLQFSVGFPLRHALWKPRAH